ncbi:MAG: hybrid sensor histidine kinase/response regulator [Alphaproteobacteria bacterium]|nr:hybrid sensor histidine kinase/response regulator [Alphaproteobacteria bacterium]
MNIVNGFADLLARQPQTSAREAEWVEHIRHAAADLTLLVDDILDLAKLEAGMVRLRMGGVELQRFLPSLRGAVADLVHRAGLRLAIELPSDVPPIRADEGRLRQVMLNLLTNAVKYNRPAGSIEIKVSEVADERVRITVRDTGIGIPPDRMAELFQPFNRLGQDTGPIEGTGVGLALSRQLVDLMGGQIGLESDPGEGTTVWVEFPRAAALQPSPQSADPTRDRGRGPIALSQPLTVVYVDPAPAHASLMQAMAEQTPGLTVVSARFGGEALVALASHRPEVLITAPLLPDMTGVELLRLAREATLVTGVRSYVLSADATADAREMALHAGFDGYLTKPIDPGTLIAVLNEQRPDGQRQEA